MLILSPRTAQIVWSGAISQLTRLKKCVQFLLSKPRSNRPIISPALTVLRASQSTMEVEKLRRPTSLSLTHSSLVRLLPKTAQLRMLASARKNQHFGVAMLTMIVKVSIRPAHLPCLFPSLMVKECGVVGSSTNATLSKTSSARPCADRSLSSSRATSMIQTRSLSTTLRT